MNNTFNIKRFGRYLGYDLLNARNNAWLSILIMGIAPVIGFVFVQFFSMVTEGTWADSTMDAMRVFAFIMVFIAAVIILPRKVYGSITDKRAGSSWILLPASTLEKFLSMLIVTCVVAPLLLGIALLASDTLLGLIFPNSYGIPLVSGGFPDLSEMKESLQDSGLHINLGGAFYLSWCENILIFTLGAICFRKSKTAKTILFYILATGVLTTILSVGVIQNVNDFSVTSEDSVEVIGHFASMANVAVNIFYPVIFAILDGGIYYRIRTIKQ